MSDFLPVAPQAAAPHLVRLLGLLGHAHQLSYRAGPFPPVPLQQLALYQSHLDLYGELFEADAPTDTEEMMLVLALLPTLWQLAADLALLAATVPTAGPLAVRLHQNIAALQLRHGITEAERSAWHTCLHSDPETGPSRLIPALMPSLIRRPPAELSAAQVLGPFLDRFDSSGVALICHQGGQNHFFGQWADVDGFGHVLRWCRTLGGPDFTSHWLGEEPLPAVAEAPAAAQLPGGEPLDLTGFTDESLLRHFMRTVDCSAVLMVYVAEEFAPQGFWRWRHPAGAQWARSAWAKKRLWCPVWDGADLLGGQLCPLTYAATIQAAGQAHRATTTARAQALGWGPEVSESCNRLNG